MDKITKLQNELKVSSLVAEILNDYDIKTKEEYYDYINPSLDNLVDVYEYTGIKEAKERIEKAINNNERILIYGDYDCDGVCATAILYNFLQKQKVEVAYFIPDRNQDGYGLSQTALENIIEHSSFSPDLVITVDCGISSHDIVEYAQETLGLEFIITDHHEIPETLPNCICINFKLDKEKGIFTEYSGAGTALRLVEALSSKEEIKEYLELAALANIGDVMPLVEDNRIITKLGFNNIKNTKFKGLKILFELSNISLDNFTTSDIGFNIVPKINAIGRLDNANEVVELFILKDTKKLENLVLKLNLINSDRKIHTSELTEMCQEIIVKNKYENSNFLVLYNKYWIPGILGITCSKIAKLFKKPTIILTYDYDEKVYTGSGRSIDGINIVDCLKSQENLLLSYGGHKMACGLKIDEINIEAFREGLNNYVEEKYGDISKLEEKEKYYQIDENLDINDIKIINTFSPFGPKNKEPKFIIKTNFSDFRLTKTKESLMARINKDFTIFSFKQANEINAFQSNLIKDIKGRVSINYFNDKESLRFSSFDANIDYNINIDNLDEDIILYNYLENIVDKKYDKVFLIKEFDNFDETLDIIRYGNFGTIIICYLEETMKNFLKFLEDKKEKDLIQNISLLKKETDSPKTTIILSPSSNVDLSLYNNIIFLDNPLTIKRLVDMNITNKSKIFTVKNEKTVNQISKKIKNSIPTREDCLEVFKHYKKITKEEAIFNYTLTYNENLNMNKLKYLFATKVLIDLGLLEFDQKLGYQLVKKEKTELEKSRFLNILKSLGEQ